MLTWLFLPFMLQYIATVPVGVIHDVSLTLSTPLTMYGTTQKCLCEMITSSNISAFNYFSNSTCQIFSKTSITNTAIDTTQITTNDILSTLPSISISSTRTSMSSKMSIVYTTESTILSFVVAGTGIAGSSMTQLNAPNAVFVTADEILCVADYYNKRIQVFYPNNTTAAFSQKVLGSPNSVYAVNSSNFYVTEAIGSNGRVSRWPSNQTIYVDTSTYGITMDSQRNLYISSRYNKVTLCDMISNTNTIIIPTSAGLSQSRHIYLDEEKQSLYIADTANHRIVKFQLNTSILTVVAGGNGVGTAANQLNNPAGVCVSKRHSTIYVADTFNNRIQKWMINGTVGVTIFGNANGTSGSGGRELNAPYSITINADGTFLYIADTNNHRILRLSIV
ncbi:unnamed protein product [Adineta ricciae]|uniref:NHL repeat containing protein-like protein n=1 Tax=Adineta ricciae TaxID=249248 RepID=A0A815NDM2_ADIRI|nr:unnamed protein product [Adineta ricciae]